MGAGGSCLGNSLPIQLPANGMGMPAGDGQGGWAPVTQLRALEVLCSLLQPGPDLATAIIWEVRDVKSPYLPPFITPHIAATFSSK